MERKEKHQPSFGDDSRRVTPALLVALGLLVGAFENIQFDTSTNEVTPFQTNWDCDEVMVQFEAVGGFRAQGNISMNPIRIRNNHIILSTGVEQEDWAGPEDEFNVSARGSTFYIPFSSTAPSEYPDFQVQRFMIARDREMIRIRLSGWVMDLVQNGTDVQTFLYANTTAPSPFSYVPRPSTRPRLAVSLAVAVGVSGLAWSSFF